MADTLLRNVETFFTTLDNKIEPSVKTHLRNVYGTLSCALLLAAVGAYVHVATDILKGNFLVALGSLIPLMLLYTTPHNAKTEKTRLAYMAAFAFCSGLTTGPLLDMVLQINPKIVVTAFMGTCAIFGCFTLAALYAPDRKFLYLGGILLSLLSTMFWLSLANLLFGSAAIFQLNLYLGLFVTCGFVLYDTQLIMEKRRRGNNDYIWHAVDLFIDFVDMFRRLMIILAQREQSRDNKKRN